MVQKNRLKAFMLSTALLLLISSSLSSHYLQLNIGIKEVGANSNVSQEWSYSTWQYRKQHNITTSQIYNTRFFDISDRWATISGNPTNRHAFQPVHNTTIVEVNKIIDGATRKYLAYDSDPDGSEIRLYYTNNTDGSWTAYSGNPILGPSSLHYRWPSVAYVNGIFHMFLGDRTDLTLERWTSTDGIHFTLVENVKTGGNQWKNPFIWFNPNDEKWYLYSHDSSGATEYFKVRSATKIEDLDTANDVTVLSRNIPFGSPTIMFYKNTYWLLGEILDGGVWKTVAYYSTTSPSSGFKEADNSPILSDDEACPMLFLDQNQNRAYLFTSRDSSQWYAATREVYINNPISLPTPKITDYQISLNVLYGSGTDSGQNLYLNGHSRTDFGDVRFTWFNSSSQSEVQCNYWIEELNTGVNATFWVKIPEISTETNTTLYVYYGKSDATTTSNGNNTFAFFDNFSGTLSNWTVVGGTWQIENGELSAQTNAFGQRIRATGFVFGNNSVHVKVKWISGTYFENGPYARGQSPNEQNSGYMTFLSTWSSDYRERISKMSGSETTIAGQGTTNPSTNTWYKIVFKLYGNKLRSSISPLYSTEISGNDNTFSSGTLCLFDWSASSEHAHFDDLFVTNYIDPEPMHGAWGSEEMNGLTTVWSSPFSVISNSTISELTFNSTSKILSFTASGPSGTIGSTNVTIAKTLIGDISKLKVYLDEQQIDYTVISNDNDWLIHLTYSHSTHKVVMILGSQHTESPAKNPAADTATIFTWTAIATPATILFTLIMIRKKSIRAKPNLQC